MTDQPVKYFDHYIGERYVLYRIPDWVKGTCRFRAMYDLFFSIEIVDKTKVNIKGAEVKGWHIDSNDVEIDLFEDMGDEIEEVEGEEGDFIRLYNSHADIDDLKRKTRVLMEYMRRMKKMGKKELREKCLEEGEEE